MKHNNYINEAMYKIKNMFVFNLQEFKNIEENILDFQIQNSNWCYYIYKYVD